MIHKTDIFAAPIICGAAIALLLAAGCSKQETAVVTGFPEDGAVRIAANAGTPATRAGGSQYEGSTLGLFIDYGSGGYSEYNIMWSKDASGQWTPEKNMLWKDGKSGADIYAYAPFVGVSMSDVNPVAFEIPEDQSAGTTAADLVSWSHTGFVPDASQNNDFSSDGKILISFSHRLVKMTFNFEKGNQFASDMTVVDATLFGTSSKVACDLKAGNVTAASDAVSRDIKLHKVENLKYETVFFPGDGQKAGAKMLEVVMSDGTPLYYTVPATGLISGGLQSGNAYEMKMRLGKDKIELASDVAVADWTESGTTLPGGESILDADSWDGTVASGFAGGAGTSDDPYLISTSAQLAYLAQQVNSGTSYAGEYFRQTKNFDLADKKWTPIGSSPSQAFRGHFDGGNKGVYCLNVDITGSYAGLFGYIRSGSVRNVGVFSGAVKSTGYNVGGIVGALVGNSSMENCTASVNVSGNVNVGGLVGSISGSTVSNCHFLSGEITGIGNDNNSIGGIVGNAQTGAGTVRDCSANASVKGKQLVGGLCGWLCNGDHSFSNCIMKGSITITSEACGGLVGQLSDSKGKLEKCRFEGSINREGDTRYTGIAIGADDSNVTFPGCECIIDAQTNTSLKGEKVGYIANKSADNEKVRADNYDYSDITVTVKGDDTQN